MRFLNDIGLDHKVVAEEFRRKPIVRQDAADSRSGENHNVGSLDLEEGTDLTLVAQIKLGVLAGDELDVFARKPAHDRRSNHSAVPRDEDTSRLHFSRSTYPASPSIPSNAPALFHGDEIAGNHFRDK